MLRAPSGLTGLPRAPIFVDFYMCLTYVLIFRFDVCCFFFCDSVFDCFDAFLVFCFCLGLRMCALCFMLLYVCVSVADLVCLVSLCSVFVFVFVWCVLRLS